MRSNVLKYHNFISEAAIFLKKYEWIFNFKWVEVGKINPWENCPSAWSIFLLNRTFNELQLLIKCDFSFTDVPEDIKEYFTFQKRCSEFILYVDNFPYFDYKTDFSFKGINPKKTHEIFNISKFLESQVINKKELNVVDIGSGLGHLPRIMSSLSHTSDISILSVEGNDDLHGRNNCKNNIKKMKFFITEDNLNDFNNNINCAVNNVNVITGLHCCGTLSCNILKLYANISSAETMLLFSCCYHRMITSDNKEFPMSEYYKDFDSIGLLSFVSPFFFRLGCQESKETWLHWSLGDCCHHQFSVGIRSAIESYNLTNKEDNIFSLKRFKIKRNNLLNIRFSDFVMNMLSDLKINNIDERFLDLLCEEEGKLKWYSIMLALQMAIQEVVEAFILIDRVLFLFQFENIKTVSLLRLFDPKISPRNIAIYALK